MKYLVSFTLGALCTKLAIDSINSNKPPEINNNNEIVLNEQELIAVIDLLNQVTDMMRFITIYI